MYCNGNFSFFFFLYLLSLVYYLSIWDGVYNNLTKKKLLVYNICYPLLWATNSFFSWNIFSLLVALKVVSVDLFWFQYNVHTISWIANLILPKLTNDWQLHSLYNCRGEYHNVSKWAKAPKKACEELEKEVSLVQNFGRGILLWMNKS